MIPMQDFPIVGSYNNQRGTTIDRERAINCFEFIDPLGKKMKTQIFTSGLVDTGLVFSTGGGCRAEYVLLDFHYIVFGKGIYRIDSTDTVTLLGEFANTTTGYVGISANDYQVVFVDGVNGYVWDTISLTFTQITDPYFPAHPIDVTMLSNFIVVINGGTPRFKLSMYDNALVWGPAAEVFTADDTPANNWLILPTTVSFQTGVPFQLSTTGTLPSPLNSTDTYYAIYVDATHIRVATSAANARAGVAVVLTSNGTPTNTITSLGQEQEGQVEVEAGTLIACRVLHRRLFLFTQYFTEIWENAGIGTTLPFRPNYSLLIQSGCAAIGSVVVDFDRMMFLSQNRAGLGSVMLVQGTQAMPVSTKAIDFQLFQYAIEGQISDCRAFFVKEEGLIFYRMNFTAADHTFVYNISQSIPEVFPPQPANDATKLWHEEETLMGNRHRAQTHGYFNGQNYVGDYENPILYKLSRTAYTNNSQPIKRTRITKMICPPGYNRLKVHRVQIDLLQGQLVPDHIYYENPNFYLSISKDGGQSWGYQQISPMGKVGERSFRTVFRKLGTIPRGQPWIVKLEFYAPYPLIILGGAWAVELLPE